MMRYWLLLILAIVAEITGTLFMKWSAMGHGNSGYFIMLLMIALSYVLLAFSIKKIALGVAYALWEGIGILVITLFSVMLFDERLTVIKIAGLALLVAGIVLIKTGTRSPRPASGREHAHV